MLLRFHDLFNALGFLVMRESVSLDIVEVSGLCNFPKILKHSRVYPGLWILMGQGKEEQTVMSTITILFSLRLQSLEIEADSFLNEHMRKNIMQR